MSEKKDGSPIDVHLSASTVKDRSDRSICIISSFIDISEIKKMQRELMESENKLRPLFKDLKEREERFRKIFELSPIGIQLFDAEGFLVDSNPASQTIMSFIDAARHKRYNIFREVITDIEHKHKLESGQIVSEGRWIGMKSAKSKDNNIDKETPKDRAENIYIENIIASLGEASKPEGYMCLQQDLTEHRLADEAMINDNERLQIIYNIWQTRVNTSNMRIKDWEA